MPIFDRLGTLAASPFAAGSANGIASLEVLSGRTMAVVLTHPGPRAAISENDFFLTLPNVKGGYTVYDRYWTLRYSVFFDPQWQQRYDDFGPNVEIPEFHFGYDTEDQIFLTTQRPGDYFYVMYDSRPRTGQDYKTQVLIVAIVTDEAIETSPSSRVTR